jgi:hypothetical protein
LFQPSRVAAGVLAERGLSVESSVFKGGLQRNTGLDYRAALKNGYYWRFSDEVTEEDESGHWIEIPVHAEMVPLWRMNTGKRAGFTANVGLKGQSLKRKVNRIRDFMRFRYPLKFDFCRMTLEELISMIDRIRREDENDPRALRPIVAIGHTKDLTDPDTVDKFLKYLRQQEVQVSTFRDIYPVLQQGRRQRVTEVVN